MNIVQPQCPVLVCSSRQPCPGPARPPRGLPRTRPGQPHAAPCFTIPAVFVRNPLCRSAILPGVTRAPGAQRRRAVRWATPASCASVPSAVRARRSRLHDTFFRLYPHPRVTRDGRCSRGDAAVLRCEGKPIPDVRYSQGFVSFSLYASR